MKVQRRPILRVKKRQRLDALVIRSKIKRRRYCPRTAGGANFFSPFYIEQKGIAAGLERRIGRRTSDERRSAAFLVGVVNGVLELRAYCAQMPKVSSHFATGSKVEVIIATNIFAVLFISNGVDLENLNVS